MRATGFTHVSIHVDDMNASLRFYGVMFGMRRVPSPDFAQHVEWLQVGDQQLHLIAEPDPAPRHHHFGLDVEDLTAVYRAAEEQGILDESTFTAGVRELADGSAQFYLRDPAGNLVEVNCRDASSIDRSLVPVRRLTDERQQPPDALHARLYPGG